MKLRENPEAFVPAVSSITVEISGNRKITILPCSPDFVPNVRGYLLHAMGFSDPASATSEAVGEASLLALRVLFAYVLDDANLVLETPELAYPPKVEDLSQGEYQASVLRYAKALYHEMESKSARRLLRWDDVTTVTEAAFGISLKADAAKNA